MMVTDIVENMTINAKPVNNFTANIFVNYKINLRISPIYSNSNKINLNIIRLNQAT